LELQAVQGGDPGVLAAVVAGLASAPPVIDAGTGRVVVPIHDGPRVLAEAASRLVDAEAELADMEVRRPSLDDVFLALTGRGVAAAPDQDRVDQRSAM
jgi:hypothetical protein